MSVFVRCKCNMFALSVDDGGTPRTYRNDGVLHGDKQCMHEAPFDLSRAFADTMSDALGRAAKGEKFEGRKDDSLKDPWDLLPWGPVQDIVKVLAYGAGKYAPNNWRKVEEPQRRYFSAAVRHTLAWWRGERIDPESKLPHLAHAACNLLFLAWFDEKKEGKSCLGG